MRIITEKDKRGMLIALRVFLRSTSGERLSPQAGLPLITKAVDGGLSFDEILNLQNWERAKAVCTPLDAASYIDILCNRGIDVRELKDEPFWHEADYGFPVVAEAVHDFYMELSGRGGKWNIPSAITNLARAIKDHSLQAIMSEALINEINEGKKEEDTTYFNYILSIVKDFNSIHVDDTPTEAQQERIQRGAEMLKAAGVESDDKPEGDEPPEVVAPEDQPYPPYEESEQLIGPVESVVIGPSNPRNEKRVAIINAISNYTVTEIAGIIATIENGDKMSITDIVDCLTDGKFDPEKESPEANKVHREINSDLLPAFISSINMQGVNMTEQTAVEFDALKENWDLRSKEARRVHRLKTLILEYAEGDDDLIEAVKDLETYYNL